MVAYREMEVPWDGIMLQCNEKHSSDSRAATSQAAASGDLHKHNNYEHRNKGWKGAAYLLKAAGTQRAPGSAPHLHCQAFNEGWEGVGPGSSPPTHSAVLHCTHLSSPGWPGLPPRAPSLLQAGTQHCHYRWGGGTWGGWGCHGVVAHGRVEVFRNGDTWAGWGCHGMVACG